MYMYILYFIISIAVVYNITQMYAAPFAKSQSKQKIHIS